MTEVVFEYDPRLEFIPFHQRAQRWACIVAHRRCGKTVACVNELVARATYTQKKNARFAYVAPYYRQAKDVAWVYTKQFGAPIISKIRESELRVELKHNGAWITLYGADNPNALRGLYFDGVILDEYGDCRPSLWGQVILPTLADRRGWATFIGTPKGKNHFYDIRERARAEHSWYYGEHKASETGIVGPEELEEIKAMSDDDEYAQEWECSFDAAVKGTYYSSLMAKLERNFAEDIPYNPDFPVSVFADLGRKDSTAFWYNQITPAGSDMVDYDEHDGQDLEFYFDMLEAKGYDYDTFFLPHDAKAETLATKKSTIEQFVDWQKRKYPNARTRIVPKLSKQSGIEAGRWAMRRTRFCRTKCKLGYEALRAYKRKYNELTKQFSDAPEHNWAADGADAYRYYAVMAKGELLKAQKGATIQDRIQIVQEPVQMNLETLWEAHLERNRQLRSLRRRI